MTTFNNEDGFVPYDPPEDYPFHEYHSAITITWGELRDAGVIDWDSPQYEWAFYDLDQKERLQKLMDGRFWFREISAIPPEVWRRQFIEKLNEAMLVAKLMYRVMDERPNLMTVVDEYHKSRSIGSDFPQTLLNGSGGDYASDGRDYEYETVRDGDLMTVMEALQQFRHPDLYVLDKLETCFTNLVSLNLNGF